MEPRSSEPRCLECGEGVIGTYYTVDGGGIMHAACHLAFLRRTADRCGQCKEPLMEGKYDDVSDAKGIHKVHDGKCYEKWKKAHP